ncbi:NAD(P)-binding protein [Aspergillus californicus]
MPLSILVTAATGRQGGAAARHLLAQGARVYALVRSPTSTAAVDLQARGAILIQGSFDEPEVLHAACKTITAVFLNVSPSFNHNGAELRDATNIITATRAPGSTVTTIVYTSVCEVDQRTTFPNWNEWPENHALKEYFTSKAAIEALVRSSEFAHWTILRPPVFMSNYLLPSVRGYFPTLASPSCVSRTAMDPTKRTMLIDPDDIGRYAAAAITHPEQFSHRAIDIRGEALTAQEIATALSEASGRDISVEYIPREAAEKIAKTNLQTDVQLWFFEKQDKFDPGGLEREFAFPFQSFSGYLAAHRDLVGETFR